MMNVRLERAGPSLVALLDIFTFYVSNISEIALTQPSSHVLSVLKRASTSLCTHNSDKTFSPVNWRIIHIMINFRTASRSPTCGISPGLNVIWNNKLAVIETRMLSPATSLISNHNALAESRNDSSNAGEKQHIRHFDTITESCYCLDT